MVEMCTSEIAIDCVRKNPGNRKAALIEFISSMSHGEKDNGKFADKLAQSVIDLFDPHLSNSIKFTDLSEAAYGSALVMFSAGVAHFASNLKAAGYINDGLNIKEKAPVAETVGNDATQIEVENGKVRLFISEHKFGAYPTCSTLLSNNHDRQVRQIMSVMDQDRKLDSCDGAWDYYMHEVQIPSRVSNSDAA